LSWTKFKEEYLFSVNAVLAEGIFLYLFRKDFTYHPILMLWLMTCLFWAKARAWHLTFFHALGFINTRLILGSFYFLFFSPFSVLYRIFFKKNSFGLKGGALVKKDTISSFDQPF
jgi:hypothetical protein